MNPQLNIDFQSFVNEPVFEGDFGGQMERLYNLMKMRPVTCQDAECLGIAGSAFARRIKDLKEKYGIPYLIEKVNYTRSFDGKNVKISQYKLVR